MYELGDSMYSSYSFLTSALDGEEWSASRPGRAFSPGERTPSTPCTGDWVGPRAGLNTDPIGKVLLPLPGSNPVCPVVQSVVRHCTDRATPAPINMYLIMLFQILILFFVDVIILTGST
jgi:hypothetical protein